MLMETLASQAILAVVVTGITCVTAAVLDLNLFIKILEIACVSLGLSKLTYSYSNYYCFLGKELVWPYFGLGSRK